MDEHERRMREVSRRAEQATREEAESVTGGPEGPSAAPGADAPVGGVTGGDPEAEQRRTQS